MATDAKKISHAATSEILCFTLEPKSYEKVTIRCLATIAGTLKSIYVFGDGTSADDTETAIAAAASLATRSLVDDAGTADSRANNAATGLVTQVFDYRLGKTLITFTPGASTSGTLYIEAITSRAGEK